LTTTLKFYSSYLLQGTTSCTHSREEGAARFEEVRNAMDLVGFEPVVQASIFSCLVALLHLGNIQFQEDANEYSYILEPRSGPVKMVAVSLSLLLLLLYCCCGGDVFVYCCVVWSSVSRNRVLGSSC